MWSILILLQLLYVVSSEHLTFSDNQTEFTNLAVDYKTGALYVGAVNKIYHLSPDLKTVRYAVTGPFNVTTPDFFDNIDGAMKLQDNFNKVLVIDYANDRLIACGTVFQGMCSVLPLININIRRDVPDALVTNNPNASVVAFLALGSLGPKRSQVLYIGVTGAISSPSMEEHRVSESDKIYFDLWQPDDITVTTLYKHAMYRNYLYGFSSGKFIYFLTTQEGSDDGYKSKIIRISYSDDQYHSYAEISLSCSANGENESSYNLVNAGFVSKPTDNLSQKLGMSNEEDILFAVFQTDSKQPSSGQKKSALCVYTIRDINEKITANINKCLKLVGKKWLQYLKLGRKYNIVDITRFCVSNVNIPFVGKMPIVAKSVIEFKETLTAVSAITASKHIIVFAGTTEGHIKKILLKNASSAVEFADVVVDEGCPINKDMFFDIQNTHLYVMTRHKVSKINIYDCGIHKSYLTCIVSNDPFCGGWCIPEKRCSSQSDCKIAKLNPFIWVHQNQNVQCTADTLEAPVQTDKIIQKFIEPEFILNHLVVDRSTDRVYVGAVNRIYQLTPDLEIAQWIITGPFNDSALCTFDCPSNYVKKPTDNVNKALVIDYATSRLIACGSGLQGLCSVRNLNNISHDVREVREPVVANNATASTVAFIAPGPPNPPMTQVMYVGVTFTNKSPYHTKIPAVSSRSLDDDQLLKIVHEAFPTGTRMFVNSLSQERYPINYVYGFSSEGFSYFLTTQLRGVGSDTYYSKLVRVCHDDENYYSYTEIPMSCTGEEGGNFGYNLVQAAFVGKAGSVLAAELGITAQQDVLFAAFSQSESINTNTPSDLSALCVYSLKAIRRKFMQNIKTCFSGNGSRGLDFISPSHPCIGTKLQSISEDFCGLDVNTPLGGEQPVEAVPVAVFTKRLTAVAATATGDYTVVFAGTAQGHLKKIVVESATTAFEYDDIVVDEGSPVNKDLLFDTQLKHLYVMTERKVSKVKVQECSVYKSCLTCLGAKDPYCGWCSLENKCSLRSECQYASKDSFYWIPYRNGRCPTITQVVPNQLHVSSLPLPTTALDLHIENFPTLNGKFNCAFMTLGCTFLTNAVRRTFGVSCPTPLTDTLPPIPAGQHHLTAILSVRTTQGPDFAATNFTFFDCNTYSSCTQCVSSSFPCNWCLNRHQCTHDPEENCRNDVLVTGVSRIDPSYRTGPIFCPRVNLNIDGNNEILVPCGTKKVIKVKVHIIGQFIVQSRFVCKFNIDGRVEYVNAQLLADTVYCEDVEFTYTSRAPNIIASFDVLWGGLNTFENPDNIHILIYRCNDMADDCNKCLALPDKFGCGWCPDSGKCEVREQCGTPRKWFNSNESCFNPEIHSFMPK